MECKVNVDPEIAAMSAVSTALAQLDDDQRDRVVRWAAERFAIGLPARGAGAPPGGRGIGGTGHAVLRQPADEQKDGAPPVYEHFAELFGAASPTSDADKALVAAYWLQEIEGHDGLQSQSLNNELKNLGHPIGNITAALTANIGKKPQRIMQLKKAGNTRQGRKTYKVTHEGLKVVRGMVSGGGEET